MSTARGGGRLLVLLALAVLGFACSSRHRLGQLDGEEAGGARGATAATDSCSAGNEGVAGATDLPPGEDPSAGGASAIVPGVFVAE